MLKGKVRLISCYEDAEGKKKYISTLSLTSVLRVWVINDTPRPFYPQERIPVSIVQEAVGDVRNWKLLVLLITLKVHQLFGEEFL
jgi:hypothetical protein